MNYFESPAKLQNEASADSQRHLVTCTSGITKQEKGRKFEIVRFVRKLL